MQTQHTTPVINSEKRRKDLIKNLLIFTLIILLVVMILFPIYWMVSTSLKQSLDILTRTPKFLFTPTLDNYVYAFTESDFARFIVNSLIVAVSSTVIVMITGTLAAYSFARWNIGGGHLIFFILSTRMMPAIAVVIPYFIIFRTLGLLDTHLALIMAYSMFNMPLAIWLLYGFFRDIPVELEESARIEGYSRFQVFRRIVLPLVAPGLAVTTVFCLLYSWNEFLFAFILTRSNAMTITVGVSSFWTQQGILWGPMAAAATICVLPMMIFAIVLQRYIIRGLSFGAVKG